MSLLEVENLRRVQAFDALLRGNLQHSKPLFFHHTRSFKEGRKPSRIDKKWKSRALLHLPRVMQADHHGLAQTWQIRLNQSVQRVLGSESRHWNIGRIADDPVGGFELATGF